MNGVSTEKHYTVPEIAKLWGMAEPTVRRLFKYQPGVLRLPGPGRLCGKREHFTLYIPQSVIDQVHRQFEPQELREIMRGTGDLMPKSKASVAVSRRR